MKLRARTKVIKKIYLDAVCREDVGRNLCELVAIVAAVVPHNNGNILLSGKTFVQIVGQALCCGT